MKRGFMGGAHLCLTYLFFFACTSFVQASNIHVEFEEHLRSKDCYKIFAKVQRALIQAKRSTTLSRDIDRYQGSFFLSENAKADLIAKSIIAELEYILGPSFRSYSKAYKASKVSGAYESSNLWGYYLLNSDLKLKDRFEIAMPNDLRGTYFEVLTRVHESMHHYFFEEQLKLDPFESEVGGRHFLYLNESVAMSVEYLFVKSLGAKKIDEMIETVSTNKSLRNTDKTELIRTLATAKSSDSIWSYLNSIRKQGIYNRDYFGL